MEGLGRGDRAALGELALAIGELETLDAFRIGVLEPVRRLVPGDIVSYNEIAGPDQVFAAADPPQSLKVAGVAEAFERFAYQNPLVAHYARTGDQRPLRLSDFVSAAALRRLDLYQGVYAPVGIEHQLAVTLSESGTVIGITVNRAGRDFGERDRRRFDAARPLLCATHRRLRDRTRLDAVLGAIERVDRGPVSVLMVELTGSVSPAHERAERLLASLRRDIGARDTLIAWIRAQRTQLEAGSRSLRLAVLGSPLECFYGRASPGQLDAVALCPARRDRGPDALVALGLTRREADVLYLVAQGRAPREVAADLGISAHTVNRHLERIYRKLDVTSRSAAVRRALDVLDERAEPPTSARPS